MAFYVCPSLQFLVHLKKKKFFFPHPYGPGSRFFSTLSRPPLGSILWALRGQVLRSVMCSTVCQYMGFFC